jgi:DNA-directed RNA polymerase subunit RPC12/RpoP
MKKTYQFDLLRKKLDEMDYPESRDSGFRIIKRDFTEQEIAGNINFGKDGIYLSVDGVGFKGYMYLKYPDISRFALPKFHITSCQTVEQQRSANNFHGRYYWHNSDTVDLTDRETGAIHSGVKLQLCANCKRQASISEYHDSAGFFNSLDVGEQEDLNKEYEVDIFGYTKDWQNVSRQYRKLRDYTCESCNIKIIIPSDKRFIHVHHKSGSKVNNRVSNLECLCILCHSMSDATHRKNFEKRKMQPDVKTFLTKYGDELGRLRNPYI